MKKTKKGSFDFNPNKGFAEKVPKIVKLAPEPSKKTKTTPGTKSIDQKADEKSAQKDRLKLLREKSKAIAKHKAAKGKTSQKSKKKNKASCSKKQKVKNSPVNGLKIEDLRNCIYKGEKNGTGFG